jgi:AraC-like DNA-binding protein
VPTVVAAWTRSIVEYAAARGVELDDVMAAAGIDSTTMERPDARIPADADDRIWQAAIDRLADPDLGLHLAEGAISARSLGVVGYLTRSSATVGQALARARRFHRLIKDGGDLRLIPDASGLTVSERPHEGPWPRAIAETIVANYVTLARSWTGETLIPLEVRFQHARPRSSEHERIFGCPVRFGADDNAVKFSADDIRRRLRTADPQLLAYLESWAEERLAALAPTRSFADDVRLAVRDCLDHERSVEVGAVAHRLATSPRSLQRRLLEEGVTFRALVDAVRRHRAAALLSADATISDVADRLGFSDARSFRRAFRRWTGQAPSARRGVHRVL